MLRRTLSALAVSSVLGLFWGTVHGQAFRPKSDLPPQLREIAEDHPVDTACNEMAGNATVAKHQAQNRAKNNFYVTGSPTTVTYSAFTRLQKAAETQNIPHGGPNGLPNDRSVLRDLITVHGTSIGEGTLVRFAALVLEARHSNVSNGESVNCNDGGRENNDIHVDLGRQVGDDACTSVTAEISPHFRPDSWDSIEDYDFQNRPVRITGPLFFDASHRPCRPGSRASPARISIWEIHPIYAVDVCRFTTFSRCRASDDSAWQPLHEWVSEEEPPV